MTVQARETPDSANTSSGIAALLLLLRFHGIAADEKQVAHQYGEPIGANEMLRCAKDMKLKVRMLVSTWERLARTPLPAIAERRDGGFIILSKASDSQILILDPAVGKPQMLERGAFESQWSGKLILMTRRAGLTDLARRFDITWFLQAMHKYRRLLAEVLVASFFLQLFALISPLFFQVVIDKVLVHRGLSTLDVIVIGLVVVSIFESVLTALRTYVFSHTTNRIDVELGARLFQAPDRTAYFLFRGAPHGRFRSARPGTGEYPQFPDRIGPDTCYRSLLHGGFPGRHGVLFAEAHRHRAIVLPPLCRRFRAGDARVPAHAQ
ncbi:MAG: cysteine peptidase family C39 domain-containing protein [Polyangiaceae bacterium]